MLFTSLETGYRVTDPKSLAAEMEAVDAELSGFDIIIECSGFPPALEAALAWTKRGATVMIFGCAPPGKAISLCPEDVFRKVQQSVVAKSRNKTFSNLLRS